MVTRRLAFLVPLFIHHASAFSAPFFDTSGRLQRTTSPPSDPQPGTETFYVPIYNGEVLMGTDDDDDRGPVLLSEAAAAPFVDQGECVVSWLGSASEAPPLPPMMPRGVRERSKRI